MGPVVEVRADTGLLAHERIAVEDVALATVAFANGAHGRDRGQHGHLSGLSEADRNPRQRRLGRDGGGRHRQVGLRQADEARRGDPAADGRAQEQRRRSGRPEGHRPSRPHPAVPRRAGGDQEGHPAARSTAPRAAARWKSFWPSTRPPKPAGRWSCRCRAIRR